MNSAKGKLPPSSVLQSQRLQCTTIKIAIQKPHKIKLPFQNRRQVGWCCNQNHQSIHILHSIKRSIALKWFDFVLLNIQHVSWLISALQGCFIGNIGSTGQHRRTYSRIICDLIVEIFSHSICIQSFYEQIKFVCLIYHPTNNYSQKKLGRLDWRLSDVLVGHAERNAAI